MRVLVVTPWFPTAAAPGSGIFNLRDVELLARDHEVRVLHLAAPGLLSGAEPDPPGIAVRRVPFLLSKPWTLFGALRAIRAELAEADLLHSMALPALVPLRGVGVRVPFVHTEHFSALVTPAPNPVVALGLRALAALFRRPTEVIAVSAALASVIDGHRRTPATVIGNEVMAPSVEIVPDTAVRGGGPLRLVAVGGAVARKGPVIAVETLAALRDRGLDASLTWVGSGPLIPEMRERADALGVAERLRTPGQLSPAELSAELLGSDLFLLPVETETFGVAIAEGLAHGLPAVVTGSGGHEEFLPEQGSRLVPERSPEALAAAIVDLIGAPDTWTRRRIAEYAAARFAPEARRARYEEVYRRAVARHAR